jgi:TonB family protein
LDWSDSSESKRWLRAGVGSVVAHVLLFTGAFAIGTLEGPVQRNAPQIASNMHVTPLIAPPTQLTQKAPNTEKLSKELNVGNLMPVPAVKQMPKPSRTFRPPVPQRNTPQEPGPQTLPDLPKPLVAANAQAVPPPIGVPNAPQPPPQIQAEEKPKLTFETPGQHGNVSNSTLSKLSPPKTTVDDSVRAVARGGGQGPIVVGDLEPPPSISESMRLPQSPGRSGSQLELLSDPQGIDFRPYLIRILALVRRNWFAVIPESAHLGARGIVQLQFSIDRSGQVPKLVIAQPSGTEALDRAAVAGISATVPFPPLPAEFKGREIRLQFSFKYGVK